MHQHQHLRYLTRQSGSSCWYYRRRLPPALQHRMGCREIRHSLRTSDYLYAARIAELYTAYLDAQIAKQRAQMANRRKDLGFDRINDLPHLTVRDSADGSGREAHVTPEDIHAMADAGLSRDQIFALLKYAVQRGAMPEQQAERLASEAGAPTAPSGPEADNNQSPDAPARSLSVLQEEWFDHRRAERGGSSRWKVPPKDETILRRLREIVGDVDVQQVTYESAELVRRQLLQMPAATQAYRGMTVPQILAAVRDTDYQPFSIKSVQDHLEKYRAFFDWLKQRKFYDGDNPFMGVKVKTDPKVSQKSARDLFTLDDLRVIFSHSTWTRFDPHRQYPYQYWAPLIALYTGARR